jgi:hypothetical protein
MKPLIKNYTTDIPVERTVAEIQKILSENGASAIAIEYHDGAITDIFFKPSFRLAVARNWRKSSKNRLNPPKSVAM